MRKNSEKHSAQSISISYAIEFRVGNIEVNPCGKHLISCERFASFLLNNYCGSKDSFEKWGLRTSFLENVTLE